VLNLYKFSSPACEKFKEITEANPDLAYPKFYKDEGYKEGLPWLYYENPADQVIFSQKRVKFRASFNYENIAVGVVNQLRFKMAEYSLDGNFLGFSDLSDKLILCAQSSEEL
jgi:hypothetical protein